MKILWYCNIMLPRIAVHLSKEIDYGGGWLVGLSDCLLQNPEVELTVVFPVYKSQSMMTGKVDRLTYFGFPLSNFTEYSSKTEEYAEAIIKQISPDIVHIFGTEYPCQLAIVNVCERLGILGKAVVNIQGLVSIISMHYYAGLPNNIINRNTFRDFVRRDNIKRQKKSFSRRGEYEIEAMRKMRHVIGRTDWDRACASLINPLAQYHFCNETLRNEFYNNSWDINKCERYSIFISQAGYPIKGLHFVLEALPEIIKRFPQTHLYIAGYDDISTTDSLMSRIKISSYRGYIRDLIEKHDLKKYITFTGSLNEKMMCEWFLKSHVFVSASSIENESNSISEAKILGTPVVASFVGGVTERLKHYETGFLYQYDAFYMLAYYVCKLFADDDLALKFSQNARKDALIMHDREQNLQNMLAIYKKINGNSF